MGNMTVINANYDVKTVITRDMKKSLTRVSNDLVCEIWVWRANEGCFEMPIFKLLKTKIQVKENRDNTRKRFYLCPSQVFFSKIVDKKQKFLSKKLKLSTEILHCAYRVASLM